MMAQLNQPHLRPCSSLFRVSFREVLTPPFMLRSLEALPPFGDSFDFSNIELRFWSRSRLDRRTFPSTSIEPVKLGDFFGLPICLLAAGVDLGETFFEGYSKSSTSSSEFSTIDFRFFFAFSVLFAANCFLAEALGFGVEAVMVLVGVFDRPRVEALAGAFFLAGLLFFTWGVATRDGVRLRERRVAIIEMIKEKLKLELMKAHSM